MGSLLDPYGLPAPCGLTDPWTIIAEGRALQVGAGKGRKTRYSVTRKEDPSATWQNWKTNWWPNYPHSGVSAPTEIRVWSRLDGIEGSAQTHCAVSIAHYSHLANSRIPVTSLRTCRMVTWELSRLTRVTLLPNSPGTITVEPLFRMRPVESSDAFTS
jgi:hypothetical protein